MTDSIRFTASFTKPRFAAFVQYSIGKLTEFANGDTEEKVAENILMYLMMCCGNKSEMANFADLQKRGIIIAKAVPGECLEVIERNVVFVI